MGPSCTEVEVKSRSLLYMACAYLYIYVCVYGMNFIYAVCFSVNTFIIGSNTIEQMFFMKNV